MNQSSSNQFQTLCFSKPTISDLNKILLQQNNATNVDKLIKEQIVNILVKNMKTIYKNIDTTKINNNNINSIFEQFKKHTLNETHNEINRINLFNNNNLNSSDIKFQRDFSSNPNSGNKLMERPTATKMIGGMGNNDQINNNFDQVFRPIAPDMDNNSNQNLFNNYTTGRTNDITSKMDEISKNRQAEVPLMKRPPTPDFLKSKRTNPDKQDNNNQFNKIIIEIYCFSINTTCVFNFEIIF